LSLQYKRETHISRGAHALWRHRATTFAPHLSVLGKISKFEILRQFLTLLKLSQTYKIYDMDQATQLTKAILSENNYKERVQKILEFVQNYLNKEILKMEYLFDKLNEEGDIENQEKQEKYVDLKKARLLVSHDIKTLMKIIEMTEQMENKSFESMGYTEDVKTNVDDEDKADLKELIDLDTTSETTEDHEFFNIPYDVDDDVDDIQEFDDTDEDDDTYGFIYHKRKNGKH
jgi:hypothetical protein